MINGEVVSTHSHPKVAAPTSFSIAGTQQSFNTQPPEGGCLNDNNRNHTELMFQHTATRRWLLPGRPSAAPTARFNTQPPEGGCVAHPPAGDEQQRVSTHSHPKVAAWPAPASLGGLMFQHTATRRWLPGGFPLLADTPAFQHTATRRWLRLLAVAVTAISSFNTQPPEGGCWLVDSPNRCRHGFNTQPPEGGCLAA